MFKPNFPDTLNPIRDCDCEIEATDHFLIHCPQFSTEQRTLFNQIKSINTFMLNQSDSNSTRTLFLEILITIQQSAD